MPLVPLASRDERHFVYLVTVELGIQCKVKTRCKIRAKFFRILSISLGFPKNEKRPQTRSYQEVHHF
jgi:hypothetical protein